MQQRRISARVLLTATVICGTCFQFAGGCRAAEEFRAAASSSLQTGVSAIAQGLIDGAFAVFTPDATTDNN